MEKAFPNWSPDLYLAEVANDETLPVDIRLDAAKALLPFMIPRPKPVELHPEAAVALEAALTAARVGAGGNNFTVWGLADRIQAARARVASATLAAPSSGPVPVAVPVDAPEPSEPPPVDAPTGEPDPEPPPPVNLAGRLAAARSRTAAPATSPRQHEPLMPRRPKVRRNDGELWAHAEDQAGGGNGRMGWSERPEIPAGVQSEYDPHD